MYYNIFLLSFSLYMYNLFKNYVEFCALLIEHFSGKDQASEDGVQRIWRLAGNVFAAMISDQNLETSLNKGGAGQHRRQGQGEDRSLEEREGGPGARQSSCLSNYILNLLLVVQFTFQWLTMACYCLVQVLMYLNAGCCRIWRLVVWGWCWQQQQWLLYPSGRHPISPWATLLQPIYEKSVGAFY